MEKKVIDYGTKEMIKKLQAETLDLEIKSFAGKLSDWAKYIAKKILSGSNLELKDYQVSLGYFMEDNELKEKEQRSEIKIEIAQSIDLNYNKNLILKEIKNIEGVNALAKRQSIELSPNVTIVYGANGSGKTGYIRLFNNAFFSRSKDKEIIPNIKIETGQKKPSCEFIFQTDENTYTLKYPDDTEKIEWQQFAVFDCKSVLIHLNEKKEFVFRPRALDFFTDLISSYEILKDKLDIEIASKNTPKDFAALFDGDSEIKELIIDLSDKTRMVDIKKHIPFTEQDRENRNKLENRKIELEVVKKNKEEQIQDYEDIKELINNLKANIEFINTYFTKEKINEIYKAIFACNKKQEAAKLEGIEKFKTDKFKNVGSPEWKAFIEAAEAFARNQEKEKYPEQGDYCLLCQQPLNEKEIILLNSFWAFIKSKAEEDSRKAKETLDEIKSKYGKINFELLPDNNVLTEWLKVNYFDTLGIIQESLQIQKELCDQIVHDIEIQETTKRHRNRIESTALSQIYNSLEKKIREIENKNVDEELQEITTAINYLNHKEKLVAHFIDIEEYLNNLKWVAKAENKKGIFNTASITNTAKRLSDKYFGREYSDKFELECEELNAHFDIELLHSGSYGSSYREFKIKSFMPSQILSEGEQRAISLADFLAEIQLSEMNRGIVFDEPVTSLDEERKGIIALRLVKESNNRQVIIFTHDLVLLSSIIGYCEDLKINFECHWIETLNGQPGIIHLRNTPSYEKSYKKSGKAQEYYAKSLNCSPEERETNIKNGFAALRTSYEALVIFDLFGGVVQRFNERVSIDSLSSVYFNTEIRDEIFDSFCQCCRYMEGHLHSDRYCYKKPDCNHLKEEINRFNTVKSKLKELKVSRK